MIKWYNNISLANKIALWGLVIWTLWGIFSNFNTVIFWNSDIIKQEYTSKVKMYWDLIKKYDELFDSKTILEDYEILFEKDFYPTYTKNELNCFEYKPPLTCDVKYTEGFPNLITEKQYNYLNQVLSKRYIELDDYIKRNYPLNYYNDTLQLFRRFIVESIYLDKSFYNECEDKNFLFWFSACWYKLDNFIIDGKFIMKKDSEIRDLFNTDLNSYK